MLLQPDPTGRVIACAIAVHRTLGPGLLESAYSACLEQEFKCENVPFAREANVALEYRGLVVPNAYRADFIVDNQVVVEVKAVQALEPVHTAQLLTYLKLAHFRVGLLLNFNVPVLKSGIRRVIH